MSSKISVYSTTNAVVIVLELNVAYTATSSATASGTCNVGDNVEELVKKVISLSQQDAINSGLKKISPFDISPGLVQSKTEDTYHLVYPN